MHAYVALTKLFFFSITWKQTFRCPIELWEPKLWDINNSLDSCSEASEACKVGMELIAFDTNEEKSA